MKSARVSPGLVSMKGGSGVARRLLAHNFDVNAALRTNATLLNDEWKDIDSAVLKAAQPRLVGSGAVIEHRQGRLKPSGGSPLVEMAGKPGVGHQEHVPDLLGRVQHVHDVIQDRPPLHGKEGLRPVEGQGVKPGRIAPCKQDSIQPVNSSGFACSGG